MCADAQRLGLAVLYAIIWLLPGSVVDYATWCILWVSVFVCIAVKSDLVMSKVVKKLAVSLCLMGLLSVSGSGFFGQSVVHAVDKIYGSVVVDEVTSIYDADTFRDIN